MPRSAHVPVPSRATFDQLDAIIRYYAREAGDQVARFVEPGEGDWEEVRDLFADQYACLQIRDCLREGRVRRAIDLMEEADSMVRDELYERIPFLRRAYDRAMAE